MKKIIGILLFIVINISCDAQNIHVVDISKNADMNYLIANILPAKTINKEIYNGGLYVNIFQLNDPKSTDKALFEGYDGVASSFLVSIIPDGDYYISSKLFKIEGLINPEIKSINVAVYPEFIIMIEHGIAQDRKNEEIRLKGI